MFGAFSAFLVGPLVHIDRAPVIDILGARLANEVILAFSKTLRIDITIDDGQVRHFLETGEVGLHGFLCRIDTDLVLVDIVFQIFEVTGFLQPQGRGNEGFRVERQLHVGGPDRVLAAALAPFDEVCFGGLQQVIAGLHAHQCSVDELLNTADG